MNREVLDGLQFHSKRVVFCWRLFDKPILRLGVPDQLLKPEPPSAFGLEDFGALTEGGGESGFSADYLFQGSLRIFSKCRQAHDSQEQQRSG